VARHILRVPSTGSGLADRLLTSLSAAGIHPPPEDVERLLGDGSLERMEPYLHAMRRTDASALPDYLRCAHVSPVGETPAAAPSPAPTTGVPAPADDVPATITEIAALLRQRVLSPVDLLERSLARIEQRDGVLNAFQLVLAEEARAAARAAEAEIVAGSWRGPLHGVPVAVKDLFDVEGTVTTAGACPGPRPASERDAVAVQRLEKAGAIVVGKTRLPEYAFWPGSTNPHYGPTANPHDPSRDAGGSSSGSAAAVADGMVYAALGSDTGGSIRIPAALCGVVGLKPTYGSVSLEGCVPLAWSLDHGGPLTRSVEDASILFRVLAGRRSDPESDVGAAPAGEAAAGLRVGVLGEDGTGRALAGEEALAAWRGAVSALQAGGATLLEVDLPEMATLRAVNFLILSVEAAAFHAPSLRTRYADYGEPCRGRLLAGFAYEATELVQAHRFRALARDRWSDLFRSVDVLCMPSQPDVAPPLGAMASVKFTGPFNALGWPALSVPFGAGRGGLPLATQLVGAAGREDAVLRAARALEAAS
jgi:Asp-tRNA(Asn)/Glu-tRNA(Gln) amidotransferase A subunit family amidase